MAVDAATSEKETRQWPLTRRHRKKKSHNGRWRGHIDKRNLTMATVCLAMGVVRLSMGLEIATWLWKRVRIGNSTTAISHSNFAPDAADSSSSSPMWQPHPLSHQRLPIRRA